MGISEQERKVGDDCMREEQKLCERGGDTSPLPGTSVTGVGILCTTPVLEVLKG